MVPLGSSIVYFFLFISLYFEVFMLLSFLRARRVLRAGGGAAISLTKLPPVFPRIAVVVPCFNEGKTVAGTLRSLLALDYPHDKIEIIVVDDGSSDNTLAVAQTFALESRIRIYSKENGGKHSAMNFALKHTDAEIIGCLDADSTVAPDALQHIIPVFNDERVAAVTPGILIKKPTTLLQHMQHAEYQLSVFNRFTLASIGAAFITPGPFSFFRTYVIKEAGGWKHGHSTEDLEMAMHIQKMGYLIGNAPKASVFTGTPPNLRALFKQRVRWTYGFLRNAIDYRSMFGNARFGNLGIIVLPIALMSIFISILFFVREVYLILDGLTHTITRIQILGLQFSLPVFNSFYINTDAIIFIIFAAVSIVILLISIGSHLGTGSRRPPIGTPLFVLLYAFIVPFWLGTAVMRAIFKTGVKWR